MVYYKDPKDVEKEADKGKIDLSCCEIRDNLGQREGLTSKESGVVVLSCYTHLPQRTNALIFLVRPDCSQEVPPRSALTPRSGRFLDCHADGGRPDSGGAAGRDVAG